MAAAPSPALIVDGPAAFPLPAYPLPWLVREDRPLFVIERLIYLRTAYGWVRIPRGYITDFGSIPALASAVTLTKLQPIGRHAWAAIPHDFGYAIGEEGKKPVFDEIFRARMEVDGVPAVRREIMFAAVHLFGGGGYRQAKTWWDTENFADPETGQRVAPPFARAEAFAGQRFGLRDRPDWNEAG